MEHGSTSAPTTPPQFLSPTRNQRPKSFERANLLKMGRKIFFEAKQRVDSFEVLEFMKEEKFTLPPLTLSRNALIRHLNNDIQRGVWNRSREEHERVLFLRERRGGEGVEEDLRPRFLEIGPRWSVLGAAEAIFPRDLRETHRQLVRKWLTSLLRVFRFSTSFRITNWPPAYRGLKILPFLLN